MANATLTLRALNRATLARQMLLRREKVKVVTAIERLAGMQAQIPRPPFIGLWSRIDGFRREDLIRAIDKREVVRGTLMRGTIHLVSRKDYIAWRPTIQPVLSKAMTSILKDALDGLDLKAILEAARTSFDAEPRTFAAMRTHLSRAFPSVNERALGFIVRMELPLVQTPLAGQPWSYHAAADFAVARSWLGAELANAPQPHELAKRYLAAFGPASGQDFQIWSGLPGGRAVLEELRPALRAFRDDQGRELFDLPKAPRPDSGEDAPIRFLPEYDNLLLAHHDRSRVIDGGFRRNIFTKNLLIPATFLVDGFVAGLWTVERKIVRKKSQVRLMLKPFIKLDRRTRLTLEEEGERLLRFMEPDAESYAV